MVANVRQVTGTPQDDVDEAGMRGHHSARRQSLTFGLVGGAGPQLDWVIQAPFRGFKGLP